MSPITVDAAGIPTQSPLNGPIPGLAVQALIRRLADSLGYQTSNPRFRAAAVTWIQDTLLEIQLADPKMQRTYVMGATATLVAGTSDYDVRQAPFSWSNCFSVTLIKVPSLENRPLERVTPEQYRFRGVLAADAGPPSYFVQLDMFRIRFVPSPSSALAVEGDYQQNIPEISGDQDRVDWPRAWDIVLLEGALYRGYKWRSEQDATWTRQYRVFRDLLMELKTGESTMAREPGKVVMTRSRRGSVIPHDNSADVRRRY